jgi:hypothetical protein
MFTRVPTKALLLGGKSEKYSYERIGKIESAQEIGHCKVQEKSWKSSLFLH